MPLLFTFPASSRFRSQILTVLSKCFTAQRPSIVLGFCLSSALSAWVHVMSPSQAFSYTVRGSEDIAANQRRAVSCRSSSRHRCTSSIPRTLFGFNDLSVPKRLLDSSLYDVHTDNAPPPKHAAPGMGPVPTK